MQSAVGITGVSVYHTAMVVTLLWRRRKAGNGAQAQRKGRETFYGMAGLGWQDAEGTGYEALGGRLGTCPADALGRTGKAPL